MNLEKIKEQFPKGYALLVTWFTKDTAGYGFMPDLDKILPRCLFDFFDGLGIVMQMVFFGYVESFDNWNGFGYIIFDNELETLEDCEKSYSTRTEAEVEGFMKCFEILEERENEPR